MQEERNSWTLKKKKLEFYFMEMIDTKERPRGIFIKQL